MAWNGDSSDVPSSSAAADDSRRPLEHLLERRVRQQSGHRERELSPDAAVADDHHPAAEVGEALHRPRHVAVVDPDADDVVGVVRDRGRERAVPQAEPAHQPEADPAGAEVPLDDGDLGQVALGVGDGRSRGDGRRLGRAPRSRSGRGRCR